MTIILLAAILLAVVVLVVLQLGRPAGPPQLHLGQLVTYRSDKTLCRITAMGVERDGSSWVQLTRLAGPDGFVDGVYTREPVTTVDPIDIDRAHRMMQRAGLALPADL